MSASKSNLPENTRRQRTCLPGEAKVSEQIFEPQKISKMLKTHLPHPRTAPRGFTLIELLVTVGVICVLAAMIFGSMKKAKESALRSQCASNLRQIGSAAFMYAADNNGDFPFTYDLVLGVNDPGGLITYLGDYVNSDYRLFYCTDVIHAVPPPGLRPYTYAYQAAQPAWNRFYIMGYFWTVSKSGSIWNASLPQKTAGLGNRVLAMCPNFGDGNAHNRYFNVLRADGRIDVRKPSSDGILLQHVSQETLLLNPDYDK
jgi:prepilin-type N-terminal cleavage/methylation domain-containing protein